MSKFNKIIILIGFFLWISALPADAQSGAQSPKKDPAPAKSQTVIISRPARIRFGGFMFSAGYGHYSGRYSYYSYYPRSYFWPWYDSLYFPSYYGPYSPLWYNPGWFTGYSRQPGMGEVKIKTVLPDADVYLDDGFAGVAKDLKSMWLEPGAYNLKLEAEGYEPFAVRIYVLSGKTVKIDARLKPRMEP